MSNEPNEWGMTNDGSYFLAANVYRETAIADGWLATPTYEIESVRRAASLTKNGFKMQIIARDEFGPKFKYQASIHIWGPDGLAIEPPEEYDWAVIQARVRKCNYCEKEDVNTERVGFAGRICADCLPKERPRIEHRGWTT